MKWNWVSFDDMFAKYHSNAPNASCSVSQWVELRCQTNQCSPTSLILGLCRCLWNSVLFMQACVCLFCEYLTMCVFVHILYVSNVCGMIADDSERKKKRRHRNYSSEQPPIAIRDFVSQQLETHISVISWNSMGQQSCHSESWQTHNLFHSQVKERLLITADYAHPAQDTSTFSLYWVGNNLAKKGQRFYSPSRFHFSMSNIRLAKLMGCWAAGFL